MKTRFSKASVLAAIELRRAEIHKQWNFDPRNGTAQLDRYTDQRAAALAYGEWNGLNDLAEELGL